MKIDECQIWRRCGDDHVGTYTIRLPAVVAAKTIGARAGTGWAVGLRNCG
jgi:hypothetical protein